MSTFKWGPPWVIGDSPCRKDIACTQFMYQPPFLETQSPVPMKAAPIVLPRESDIGAIWGREVGGVGEGRTSPPSGSPPYVCIFSLTGLICAGLRR